MKRFALVAVALLQSSAAWAGDTVLYGPAPAWVTHAAMPDLAKLAPDAPALLIFDSQQRVQGDTLRIYVDTATRAISPEALSQLATVSLPWAPDKGDLTVHELSIQRGSQRIDLLAAGQKFTVIRREEAMEQRALTGILTATLPVEGLQVGDVLRMSLSITTTDKALAGRVQNVTPVPTDPIRIGFGRMRVSWPEGDALSWKVLTPGVSAAPVTRGGFTQIEFTLPAAKMPEAPNDAPVRFKPLPLLELTTFRDWAEVSRTMAPLYASDGLISDGSPLAAEVAAIAKADPTPLGRTARALRLVQDQIRYLGVFMNGGNYVPQAPARTWELRYGDCKAKSLLLLAMLRRLGIEAEAVLASSQLGDWLPQRLPSAAAFDHVIVRAVVDGQPLWLDGTRTGARAADLMDTPPFRYVLPLRTQGAGLAPLTLRRMARPLIDVEVDADESASVDLPSALSVRATVRGDNAGRFALARQLGAEQKRELAKRFFGSLIGTAQYSDIAISYDESEAAATVSARAVVASPWEMTDRRMRRDPLKLVSDFNFAPDRARGAWAAMPVAVDGPFAMRWRSRLKLPENGRGYVIEGEQSLDAQVAGVALARSITTANGIVVSDERIDQLGGEIPAAGIGAERDKLAGLKSRAPRIVAPADARRRWNLAGGAPAGSTQVQALEDIYAKAIAADPGAVDILTDRASFRSGIGNRAGALEDFSRAIAIAPSADLYLSRSGAYYTLGRIAEALSDAEAAWKLDPSVDAVGQVAQLRAEHGDLAGALALLDERIAQGGQARNEYRFFKATVLGGYGDPADALKQIDAAIADKPGSPRLLNLRCWIKATRSVQLDTALKDCTSAIELSENTAGSLDSRAFVSFRLGRRDDALRDLDAALAQAPGMAASLYMRGVVLKSLDRPAEAQQSLALARRIYPRIDVEYARYGIKP